MLLISKQAPATCWPSWLISSSGSSLSGVCDQPRCFGGLKKFVRGGRCWWLLRSILLRKRGRIHIPMLRSSDNTKARSQILKLPVCLKAQLSCNSSNPPGYCMKHQRSCLLITKKHGQHRSNASIRVASVRCDGVELLP